MTNETNTGVRCAEKAALAVLTTRPGQVFLGIVGFLAIFNFGGHVFQENVQTVQTHVAELREGLIEQGLAIQAIRNADNVPEKLQWDLVRLEGIALSNQVYGLAFMEIAAELLPENDCEAIHSLARERVDAMRRELREAATPTIPPSLQEKLNQREGRDAD